MTSRTGKDPAAQAAARQRGENAPGITLSMGLRKLKPRRDSMQVAGVDIGARHPPWTAAQRPTGDPTVEGCSTPIHLQGGWHIRGSPAIRALHSYAYAAFVMLEGHF